MVITDYLKYIILHVIIFLSLSSFGQSNLDTLTFKNGDKMIGEIKSFSKGVFTIKTDYSKSDFKVEWLEVDKVNSGTHFLVTVEGGRHYFGRLENYSRDSLIIYNKNNHKVVSYDDLVYLQEQGKDLSKKLQGSFDMGFSYTKANNYSQLTSSADLKYTNNFYISQLKINNLFSKQDSADDIKRNEASVNFQYLLKKDYYFLLNNDFLNNSEQSIDLRYTLEAGVGKYFFHTNKFNLGTSLGMNYLNEKFMNELDVQESAEAFVGIDLDIFDMGDIDLDISLITYKSLNIDGRWREDLDASLKYDLPLNFYIKVGFSLDYDNKPAEIGKDLDFVITTSFGWNNK